MIAFTAKLDKQKVENVLMETITSSVVNNTFEVNGFNLKFKLNEKLTLDFAGKSIFIKLPLDLEVSKQSGLFSVAGHGSLALTLRLQYEITPAFQLITKTELSDHRWTTPPVIDLGSLDIPVEKVVDMMLKHYDSVICGSIDKVIKEKVDISQQVDNALKVLKDNLNDNSYFGLRLFLYPYEVLFEEIREERNTIVLNGAIKLEAVIADKSPFTRNDMIFTWAENILQDNINLINLKIDEEIISNILCEQLNKMEYGGEKLQTKTCVVDFTSDHHMNLNITIDKPIAGALTIKAKPKYNESDETLNISKLDIDVKPESFIYKLTAPLLSKFLASEVKNNLPIQISKILNTYTSPFKNKKVNINDVVITTNFKSLQLKELTFDDKGVKGILQLNDLVLEVAYGVV